MAHEKERELLTQFVLRACEDQKTITPAYIDDFLSTLPEEKEEIMNADFELRCDVCGFHPSIIYKTQFGTFCEEHVRYI
jgi:hypothetical protein